MGMHKRVFFFFEVREKLILFGRKVGSRRDRDRFHFSQKLKSSFRFQVKIFFWGGGWGLRRKRGEGDGTRPATVAFKKWKLSRNMYALHACFLYAWRRFRMLSWCLVAKISSSELCQKLFKVALLVGQKGWRKDISRSHFLFLLPPIWEERRGRSGWSGVGVCKSQECPSFLPCPISEYSFFFFFLRNYFAKIGSKNNAKRWQGSENSHSNMQQHLKTFEKFWKASCTTHFPLE